MDRLDAAFVAAVLLGVGLILFAPPDPQYGVDAQAVEEAPSEPVVPFESLDTAEREVFRSATQGDANGYAEPPPLERGYVRFDGTVYRVRVYASEGPVLSVLMPLAGQWLAALGAVGFGGRRLWRAVR